MIQIIFFSSQPLKQTGGHLHLNLGMTTRFVRENFSFPHFLETIFILLKFTFTFTHESLKSASHLKLIAYLHTSSLAEKNRTAMNLRSGKKKKSKHRSVENWKMSYFHFRSSQLAINLGMDLLSMCEDMFFSMIGNSPQWSQKVGDLEGQTKFVSLDN